MPHRLSYRNGKPQRVCLSQVARDCGMADPPRDSARTRVGRRQGTRESNARLIGEAARQRDIDPVHGPARSDLTHDPLKSTWVVVPTSAAEGKGENSVAHSAQPNVGTGSSSQTISCCRSCETSERTDYADENQGNCRANRQQTASDIFCRNACGIVRHSTLWLLCRMRHSS
jgi:hypothetical protein